MMARLRRYRTQLFTGGGQLLLLLVGLRFSSHRMWVLCLAGIIALSFYGWVATVRRWRAIGDTPTSRVSSAAQGYVELAGTARHRSGEPLAALHSGFDCCWYRYLVEKKQGSKWRHHDEGESTATFVLQDATGRAEVDPDGAEVVTKRRKTWIADGFRYTEWLILDGDPLYVLGEFGTRRPLPTARDAHAETGRTLAEWKADRPGLLGRFDLDGSGAIDDAEWQLARAEARRQVARAHEAIRAAPATDVVRRPSDGKLFLVASIDTARLHRSYAAWAWMNLAALLVAGGAIAWVAFR
jgi:hypothetical protein